MKDGCSEGNEKRLPDIEIIELIILNSLGRRMLSPENSGTPKSAGRKQNAKTMGRKTDAQRWEAMESEGEIKKCFLKHKESSNGRHTQ